MKNSIIKAAKELYYLDDNNTIEIYADYKDTNDFLLQAAYDNRNSEDIENILHDKINEVYCDYILEIEDEICDLAAKKYLNQCSEIEKNEFDMDELREQLSNIISIVPDFNHFMNQRFKVNIMISTQEEIKSDHCMNKELYYALTNPTRNFEKYSECGIGCLVKQQGHTIEELKQVLEEYDEIDFEDDENIEEFKSNHNEFLTSICDEYMEYLYDISVLTVLTNVNLYEFIEMNKPGNEIVIPSNAEIGLFNPWNGSGSMLEIELEKDLMIKNTDIYRIQIDERCVNNKEYTVDETYGLVSTCWKPIKEIRNIKEPLISKVENCSKISVKKNESLGEDYLNKDSER